MQYNESRSTFVVVPAYIGHLLHLLHMRLIVWSLHRKVEVQSDLGLADRSTSIALEIHFAHWLFSGKGGENIFFKFRPPKGTSLSETMPFDVLVFCVKVG